MPDVLVVGGGPAGSALAAWLGRAGREVLLLDRATFPRDKVCGECLVPGALPLLEDLGVLPALREAGARPYRGLRLVAADGSQVEAPYPKGAHGYTLSRVALDAALLENARRTPGVTVREGATVAGLTYTGRAITGLKLADGDTLAAPLVVGADGRFSTVRRLAFGKDVEARCDRFCFLATFEGGPEGDDWLECGLVARGLQYLRVYQGEGRTSVCLVVDGRTRDRAGFEQLVREQPRLAAALGPAKAGKLKGMPLVRYGAPAIVADGLLLVGDAVGFMDPITGEGMCRALHAAKLAAETIATAGDATAGSLAPYARGLAERFDPVVRFVELAVRMTTLPASAGNVAVKALRWPPLAGAVAATQGALQPPQALFRPWRWEGSR